VIAPVVVVILIIILVLILVIVFRPFRIIDEAAIARPSSSRWRAIYGQTAA
jgi:hypothetical protein